MACHCGKIGIFQHQKSLFKDIQYYIREKGRNLTQSYDKGTNIKNVEKKRKSQYKIATKFFDNITIIDWLRTVS